MEGTMGPAEIAHCQEPGRTGPARPSRAGCRCCGTARPRYPTFTHSSPTGRPGCFASQVIRVGSPEGRRAHGLTSTVLVERLVPLSGFRKPRLGHQQAAAIRLTLALLEEHPAGRNYTDFHKNRMLVIHILMKYSLAPVKVRTDRAVFLWHTDPGCPGQTPSIPLVSTALLQHTSDHIVPPAARCSCHDNGHCRYVVR
ncbi:unnamed protein product [Leuciscus chuanchicus]